MYVTWWVTSSPLLQVCLGALRCYSKAWYSSLCCLREQSQASFFPCVFLATSSNNFCCCFDCTREWLTLLVLQKLLSALFDCLISMLALLIWSHVKGGSQDESVVSLRRSGQPKGVTVSYALEQESQPPWPPASLETYSREISLSLPSEILRREGSESQGPALCMSLVPLLCITCTASFNLRSSFKASLLLIHSQMIQNKTALCGAVVGSKNKKHKWYTLLHR